MAEQIAANSLVDERATTGAMRRWFVVVRLLVVIVGGYAAASALVAGSARLLPIAGLPRSEAVVLASMLGFLFYLALLVWGFAQARLANLVLGLLLMGTIGIALMLVLGD
jgi:hypothetical protein